MSKLLYYPGQIKKPDYPSCGDEEDVCENYVMTGCTINGIMIEDYPNEYCLTSPDNERCAIIEGVGWAVRISLLIGVYQRVLKM